MLSVLDDSVANEPRSIFGCDSCHLVVIRQNQDTLRLSLQKRLFIACRDRLSHVFWQVHYLSGYLHLLVNTRAIKRLYSGTALEAWLARLDCNWERLFQDDILEAARELYRDCAVREIELSEEDAIIHVRSDELDGYAVIDWNGNGPQVRSSTDDPAFGQKLAVAGLYEIEELVGDEASDLPPVSRPDKTEIPEENQPNRRTQFGEITQKAKDNPSPVDERPARTLLLVFQADARGLNFQTFWDGKEKGRIPALGKGCEAAGELTNAERELVIRLASVARRSNFRFRTEDSLYWLTNVETAPSFIRRELPKWSHHFEVELPNEVKKLTKGVQEANITATATLGKDRNISIDWIVDLDGNRLSGAEARRLISNGGTTMLLPDQGLANLPQRAAEVAESWREIASLFADGNFPRYLVFSLFGADEVELKFDDAILGWRNKLMSPETSGEGDLLELLRDYQRHGAHWMSHLASNDCHGLLADEMGLGKTLQVLSLLNWKSVDNLPSLVVCPASVIPVWQMEVKRFFPHLRVAVLGKESTFADTFGVNLWVASYTQLRRHKHLLSGCEFAYAVLDEAQFIKNPDAKVTQACLSIKSKHRLALTGTPVENRLLDVWTLFRFLMPGLLGSRRRFENAVSADPDALLKRLRGQIGPFVLRRTKAEVASELPEKLQSEILCPMSGLQRSEYDRLAKEGLSKFGDDLKTAKREHGMTFLSLLTRLRQTCCDPGLLPWVDQNWESSGKIQVLLDRLEEVAASGRRAVIFSQFVKLLERLERALDTRFPDVERFSLTGRTRDRAEPVRAFQKLKKAGFIMVSLKAGGTGITLTNADYVFLLDPWWNPAVEDQAIDRVHRIGKRNSVFVYRLVAAQSIEQKIQLLQAEKRTLFGEAIGGATGGESFEEYCGSLQELLAMLPEDVTTGKTV